MNAVLKYQFSLEVRCAEQAVGFGPRPIPESVLEPARAEAVFLAQRRGVVGADSTGVDVRVQPGSPVSARGPRQRAEVDSVRISVECGGGRVECEFGRELFMGFGESMVRQLLQSQQLPAGSPVTYHVFAERVESKAAAGQSVVRQRPLSLIEGSLEAFLRHAQQTGPPGDDHPVFVTESALGEAFELGWQGRHREGGVWLVGGLYRQAGPQPEIFSVIDTVLAIRGARHERFLLDLSPDSFADLQQQLVRRRRHMGRAAEMALGVYHTHPFLPSVLDGKEACPQCPLRSQCNLTSAFFSQTDARFHSALFGRSPFAVEMVLGLTPREEFDLRMFCHDGGQFRQRGFFRLSAMPSDSSDS